MTNSQWWSLVGYSKHEAQRRQTLGHQVWYVALPAPAGHEDDDRSRRRSRLGPNETSNVSEILKTDIITIH